ncbi:hypothetical protein L3Y34_001553 [Caenorhabditis briggsae]|uniref:Uncharacterized protein n=1 Tax=Caenorhabditis briggsae TaxID=6238 RepID=A0AAE9DCQ4_CAEBR|nr:hypothetical protein L3Y34_001553 [Caenorhabditis briggsae]
MDSCEEECDLEVDSDEEEQLLGEKCISLLASLLPPSSSTLLNNAIHLELDEFEPPPPLFNLLEEQQFQEELEEDKDKENEKEFADSEKDIEESNEKELLDNEGANTVHFIILDHFLPVIYFYVS